MHSVRDGALYLLLIETHTLSMKVLFCSLFCGCLGMDTIPFVMTGVLSGLRHDWRWIRVQLSSIGSRSFNAMLSSLLSAYLLARLLADLPLLDV